MKILSLKTNGFRKFPGEFKTKFYDTTYIFGGNHKGKTNILFAIVWAILGTNLTGDERAYLGHKSKNDYYVELNFKDNKDNLHTIIRYKNRFDNGKNFLTLDGKISKQEDLINFYHNKNLFLSIVNLAYFVGLQPAKQKELIDKYLPNIDIKQVYEKLSEEQKSILDIVPTNVKLYINELDNEIKFMDNKITNLRGQIEYAEKIINEPLQKPKEFEKQQELDLSIQELEHLKSEKNIDNKIELQKMLVELQNEELELNLDINKLEKELQNGKKIYQEMINQKDCFCPTCKQLLNDNSKIIASKQYRNDLITLFDKQVKLKERYKQKHFDKIACEGKIISLENSNNPISPETLRQLEENIRVLELEKQENIRMQNEYNVKLENIQKSKNDIKELNNEIVLLNNSILETQKQSSIAKQLYFNSIKEKMQAADKYLKDVKIRFYKVIKTTGEIKDDFVITYKDKDFGTLSRSEKIATSLEIANMLNKITNLNVPFFIDDSESYPDFDFVNEYKDTQIIIAQVKKGHPLRITNCKNKIIGYTSNITLHRKSNNKKQLVHVA